MKRSFFQAAVVSILLYGCTTWTLTKRLEKKLDGNYTRMLRAILNKSWRQHPTKHQLYGQTRRTRRTTSTNIHIADVRIRDVALKTCQRRWTIGRSGEIESGISVLAARHDDDEDDASVLVFCFFFAYIYIVYFFLHIYIYIYIYENVQIWKNTRSSDDDFIYSSNYFSVLNVKRFGFLNMKTLNLQQGIRVVKFKKKNEKV